MTVMYRLINSNIGCIETQILNPTLQTMQRLIVI